MQQKKEEEKELLDMQDGGLVKKKDLATTKTKQIDLAKKFKLNEDKAAPFTYDKFKQLPPVRGGSLEASYRDSRLTKKPKTSSRGLVSTKVEPKYQGGSVSLNVPVSDKYIKSIGGSLGGGRSRTRLKQSFLNDPFYEEVVEQVHRNASLQLGLNPENLPLNLKNVGLAYNDYKNVLKNTAGTENRQKGTGYQVEATFQTNPSGELTFRFNKDSDRTKRGYIGYRSRFQDGGRAEEIKTLVEGGHDVEFAMDIEPYIKNDKLAQYGSEVKEPMMDPKAKPKDMFSTVNVRLGNQRGLAGMYTPDPTNLIKQGDELIEGLSEEQLKEPFFKDFTKFIKKLKTQTPYKKAEEYFKLDRGELKDKPQSFMPAKDASFVSLEQSDHVIGEDQSKENPYLTKPENIALVFIHEARHKAVERLNLRPMIEKTLDHIPAAGAGTLGNNAEEVLMRFMDYENAITPEQKENSKKWVLDFYGSINRRIPFNLRFAHPFQNTKEGKLEFAKLSTLSSIVNTLAKTELENLRGVPVYEDEDYPESLSDQIDRKGIFSTMFPQNVRDR